MPAFTGGPADDVLTGGATSDTLSGGLGGDTLSGGDGRDFLFGHSELDVSSSSGRVDVHQFPFPFDTPVFATAPPGDTNRLFVVEVTGQIQIVNLANEQKAATPFLDIPFNEIGSGGERGLLGLAFSPDYATSGKFYVSLARPTGEFQVLEYTRSATNPDVADPASAKLILSVPHPETQHYGGWMAFGPDGNLYIATGDGKAGQVPTNPAQDPNALLGKILRIDVSGDDFPDDPSRNYRIPADNPFVGHDGADEVFAMGLRNPWRASFDAEGNLYVADVGEDSREEVNLIPAGSGGGQNFGWAAKEGTIGPDDPRYTDPVLEYPHGDGEMVGNSITGGYVYAGPGGAQGLYFFGDFMTPNIWVARFEGGEAQSFVNIDEALVYDSWAEIGLLTSFGVDGSGRLYAMTVDGNLFRLSPTGATGDGGDSLSGGGGDDQLWGGFGPDTLDGGTGSDMFWGGLSADVFVFRSAPSNPGHVVDFKVNTDKLDVSTLLSNAGYSGSDPVGDGYIRFVSASESTQVVFDPDGNGAASGSVITTLNHVTGSGFTSSQMLTPNSISPPPAPTVGFTSSQIVEDEGNSGSSLFTFTVARSGPTSGTSTVNWSVGGSGQDPATASDFANGAFASGTLTFAAGETSKTIVVQVAGDTAVEANETFNVTLSGASGATIGNGVSTGVIANDDQPPSGGGQVVNSPGPNSVVTGGAGDDTLNASQGSDTLTGGAGSDLFVWSREPWSPATVTDFAVGSDRLDISDLLEAAGYTGSDPVADKYVTLLTQGSDTLVLFDRDGTGPSPEWPNYIIKLAGVSGAGWAQLTGGGGPGHPPPTGGQVINSPGPNSVVAGGEGADTLNASRGSDTLTGNGGADVFAWAEEPWSPATVTDFALGADRLDLSKIFQSAGYTGSDPVADGRIVLMGQGSDTLVLFDNDGQGGEWPNYIIKLQGVSSTGLTWSQLASGGGGGDPPPPTGQPGQVINSPGPGSNLVGGSGDDTLNASRGPDTLTGNGGADRFVFADENWAPATITDFVSGQDKIDLRGVFDDWGYAGSDPFADGRVILLADSAGTKVLLDDDGPGGDWGNYVLLIQGVQPGQIAASDWTFQ